MISLNATGATSAASYHLNQNNRNLQKSLTKLSSGYRITSAVDDPGGLAVSMKLSAAIRRTDAVLANVANALSFLETQDGVLEVAAAVLIRMSELSTLASNVAVSTSDIALYDTEFQELQDSISLLVDEEFNGISLFAASGSTMPVVISVSGLETAEITKLDLDSIENAVVVLSGINTTSSATSASVALESAIQALAELRANNGAEQTRMASAKDILAVNRINLEAANSRIMDVDIAYESTNFVRLRIIQEAGLAVLAQANTSSESSLRLLE
jgi:flagellin